MSLRLRLLAIVLGTCLALAGVGVLGQVWVSSTWAGAVDRIDEAATCVDIARQTQVAFKEQVQEWKNVLLRGHDPEDRSRYWRQFHEREADVRASGAWLLDHLPAGPARDDVERFLADHAELGTAYRAAFVTVSATPRQPWRADARVRGIDRAPTTLLDDLVEHLRTQVIRTRAEARAQASLVVGGSLGGSLLLLLGVQVLLPWGLRRWITTPIGDALALARRLADGDRDLDRPAYAPAEAGALLDALARLRDNLVQAEAERDAHEHSLVEARDEALAAAAARERFLSVVSHELRTPLHGVCTPLQLLEHSLVDAADRELLAAASLSAARLSRRIDDVITFTAARADALVVQPRRIALDAVLREAVREPFARAAARGLDVHLVLDPDLPPCVHADPERVRQVLGHLLDNAVRFTEEGSVACLVERRDASLVIQVVDTGPGMASEVLDRALRPLHQLDDSRTRAHDGLGLGLAIADAVVQRLGGRLDVHGGAGGTRIEVHLPLRAATDRAADAA